VPSLSKLCVFTTGRGSHRCGRGSTGGAVGRAKATTGRRSQGAAPSSSIAVGEGRICRQGPMQTLTTLTRPQEGMQGWYTSLLACFSRGVTFSLPVPSQTLPRQGRAQNSIPHAWFAPHLLRASYKCRWPRVLHSSTLLWHWEWWPVPCCVMQYVLKVSTIFLSFMIIPIRVAPTFSIRLGNYWIIKFSLII
jgi:hypothetical protein